MEDKYQRNWDGRDDAYEWALVELGWSIEDAAGGEPGASERLVAAFDLALNTYQSFCDVAFLPELSDLQRRRAEVSFGGHIELLDRLDRVPGDPAGIKAQAHALRQELLTARSRVPAAIPLPTPNQIPPPLRQLIADYVTVLDDLGESIDTHTSPDGPLDQALDLLRKLQPALAEVQVTQPERLLLESLLDRHLQLAHGIHALSERATDRGHDWHDVRELAEQSRQEIGSIRASLPR